MSSRISRLLAPIVIAAAALTAPEAARAVDWAKIAPKKVMMMYPAQTSWERLMIRERHSGVRRYAEGKNCFSCHGNIDEKPLGDGLVHAEKYKEPTPIAGKPGFLDAQVKVARDKDTLYVRIEFDTSMEPNAGMDKDFDTKVTLMIDDGNVPEANRAGCWVACHDDVVSMARGKEGTTKYLSDIFVPGAGTTVKEAAELDAMRTAGKYFEYWQARLNPGAKAVPLDGTILEKRADSMTPAVMADATRSPTGVWTVTLSRKLMAGPGRKDIVQGKTYNIGFSVHAGHTAKRFHYVSLERTLALDAGTADFIAKAN